ncbi:LamB/YcsF family protein [Cellulomonas humilata]|uniref:LamB/YcsF family protein n=1 Tax=Cellulomonas humilata TaxID=144055 RepID=A0A7Y5ZXQ5_9CELL|nr:5-oxoprolinase subunit PxpA [Cellulomonas humilata]NUU16078.1 LamB/YcsF family protein [Cellulomonas humilata]
MAVRIDLNCDLGEELDAWEAGVDGLDMLLLDVVTSANVACGYHAGDERIMAAVCRAAAARGVAVGAHVSYLDREHFGRRFLDVPADELRAQVTQQVAVLAAIALREGTRVAYVKPHGALYNAVVHHQEHARSVMEGVGDLPVLGLPGSAVLEIAARTGRRAVAEAFADRGYRSDGTLVPRSEPGALVTDADEVAARVVRLAQHGVVRAVDGSDVRVVAESVCVHSDTPGAAVLARSVRAALERDGVAVAPFTGPGA